MLSSRWLDTALRLLLREAAGVTVAGGKVYMRYRLNRDSLQSESAKSIFGVLFILLILVAVFLYFLLGSYFLGKDVPVLFAPYYTLVSHFSAAVNISLEPLERLRIAR